MNNILFIFLAEYPRQLFHSSWIFGPRVHQFEAPYNLRRVVPRILQKKNNIYFFPPYIHGAQQESKKRKKLCSLP
jgi:hypothetical protein